MGRFLNADGSISANGDINMFAYCSNNPVMYKDENGQSATIAITGIASGSLGIPVLNLIGGCVLFSIGLITAIEGCRSLAESISATQEYFEKLAKAKAKAEEMRKAIKGVKNRYCIGLVMSPKANVIVPFTPIMTLSTAIRWLRNNILAGLLDGYISKFGEAYEAVWGFYTPDRNDAQFLAIAMIGGKITEEPAYKSGEFCHFHSFSHNVNFGGTVYEHFHVWYGVPIIYFN